MKKPKISVILPPYNGERYIAQSIQSVIDQTEKDWELIIVNDCSTDSTLEIASEFAKKDKRIKVISNKKNSKLPASLNEGFRNAKGEYLTWTSDDNYYKPDALKKLSDYLDEHPKTDLVSMAFDFVDENDKFMYSFESCFKYKRCQPGLLLQCNVGAAFMYRKTIADRVGEYDTYTFCAEDYDYWCRIALNGKIDYTPDNIYVYRMQPNSLTATKQAQIQEKTKYIQRKYAEAFFNKFNYTALDKLRFYKNVLHETNSKLCYLIGLYQFAVKAVCCLIFYPKKLRKNLRSRLLRMDKYSFSTPNKEYTK